MRYFKFFLAILLLGSFILPQVNEASSGDLVSSTTSSQDRSSRSSSNTATDRNLGGTG